MEQEGTFEKTLDRVGRLTAQLKGQLEAAQWFCRNKAMRAAYEETLRLEETAEKLTLFARCLPVYTGCPFAGMDARNITELSIPVEIGFTKEGWFGIRIPALLPKKETGSAEYVRSFLYPAMGQFFRDQPPVRYRDCVLIFRHVYGRDRPERQRRDHDNIEVNMVSDIVALYVMPDDGPGTCAHYYCSAEGTAERTEIYVVSKKDFSLWLDLEKMFPKEGVELYETQRILGKKDV